MDYNGYQPSRGSGNTWFIVLFMMMLMISTGVVVYMKYDDIVVMFEQQQEASSASESPSALASPSTSPSDSASESPSESALASPSTSPSTPASESPSESASESPLASDTASESTTESKPADVGIGLPYTTNGTKNIGDTCNTNEDCRSSFALPMVCKAQTAGETKQCRKLSVDDGGVNSCYKYQCNRWMKHNLKNQFNTASHDDHNDACYGCNGRYGRSLRKNNPQGNTYHIGLGMFNYHQQIENIEGGRKYFNKKRLYNKLCHLNNEKQCEPNDANINRFTGDVVNQST